MNDVQAEELKAVFRENLVALRKEKRLSQGQLADILNKRRKRNEGKVHVPYLSALEQGTRSPTLETIAELAEALDTTPDALLAPRISKKLAVSA